MSTPSPTDAELQALSVLWDAGPSTARAVLDAMPDGKTRSYTTVLSTLQQMEAKGLVKRAGREGRAIIYKPANAKRRVLGPVLKRLVQRAFAGRPADVVQHLLQDGDTIPPDELARMRELIVAAEKDQKAKARAGGKAK